MDLTLTNLQWLICHKTQPKQVCIFNIYIYIYIYIYKDGLALNNLQCLMRHEYRPNQCVSV